MYKFRHAYVLVKPQKPLPPPKIQKTPLKVTICVLLLRSLHTLVPAGKGVYLFAGERTPAMAAFLLTLLEHQQGLKGKRGTG